MKGCPYDNAVAEATYKMMKAEFIHQLNFNSLRQLELDPYDYDVQEHQRHSSVTITLDTYTHYIPSRANDIDTIYPNTQL